MNLEQLKERVRAAVECGCCRPSVEAIDRVAQYVEVLYPDEPGRVPSDEYLNDLYLFCVADRQLTIESLT